jgi:hypothetical protein
MYLCKTGRPSLKKKVRKKSPVDCKHPKALKLRKNDFTDQTLPSLQRKNPNFIYFS